MQTLLLSMQAIAAKRDEGLRLELISLSHEAKANQGFGIEKDEPLGCAPEAAPATTHGCLDVEVLGPKSLLPYGHKCRLHFDASGAVTVTIGIRNYGHGYASPYFASLVVSRLAIPATRVRLYYAGDLPAAKTDFRDLRSVPTRESVGFANAQIGELIEGLCDAAIEKGRRCFAATIGMQARDVRFEAASGRFLGAEGRCCVHILELAKAACDGRPVLEFVCRAR